MLGYVGKLFLGSAIKGGYILLPEVMGWVINLLEGKLWFVP